MPNIRNASSNIVCERRVNDKDPAIRCDICQVGIRLKCNKFNHID